MLMQWVESTTASAAAESQVAVAPSVADSHLPQFVKVLALISTPMIRYNTNDRRDVMRALRRLRGCRLISAVSN